MNDFSGMVALVTGAGSAGGIGFATARFLAERGARVVVSSTTERILERCRELGGQSLGFVADLSDAGDANRLAEQVAKAAGRIDILVNNAGMVQTGREIANSTVEMMEDGEWQAHLAINLSSAFYLTRAVLPVMRRQAFGRVINMASVTGPLVTNPGMAGYSAAKAGLAGLTRATAIETAPHGITVNAVAPGWIATASQGTQEALAGLATPAGRSGSAEEVAAVVGFLASREASYVTGQMIVVDGGNSIQEFKGNPGDWVLSPFAGKSVLIAGAGGMGLAAARSFAAQGAKVMLADIHPAAALADGFDCITADVRRVKDCRRAVDETAARHGRLDVLLNAAGVWWEGASESMSEADYDRVLDVNLKGAYFLSAAAIPHLEITSGQMIHIASDAGLIGNAGAAAYCASKGGLVLLVKALALELAPKGVRVNAICPCDVETPMLASQAERFGEGDPAAYRARLKAQYPQGPRTRFATPEEVAAFILAVAGIEAITGAALQIDFGTTAGK